MFSEVPSAVRRVIAALSGLGRASRMRWETIRRITACAVGTTTAGARWEESPPTPSTRRSGAGRKAGGSWASRRSSTAAARGSSVRITLSTKARVKSRPFGSRRRSESSFAGPGTGRAAAAVTQSWTCVETCSGVGTACRSGSGVCGVGAVVNGVFS